MNKDTNEVLFLIANEFLTLNDNQKLNVGLKLGLVSVAACMYSPRYLEEQVFVRAYKTSQLARLVEEIQRVKNAAT